MCNVDILRVSLLSAAKSGEVLHLKIERPQICRRHRPDSNLVKIGPERPFLQDEDHFENDPHLARGFLYLSFRMLPEKIRSKPELVGSDEIRQASREHPKQTLRSTKLLGHFFCHSTLNFFGHLSDITPLKSRNIRVPRLAIPEMFLMVYPFDGC